MHCVRDRIQNANPSALKHRLSADRWIGVCGGGGSGQRGDRRGKSRRCSLIYLYGTACTADPSRNGGISKAGWDCSRSDFDVGWRSTRPMHETEEMDRRLGEDEEMLGEARDQLRETRQVDAGCRERRSRLIIPTQETSRSQVTVRS